MTVNIIATVRQWMQKAKQISPAPEINVRRVAFQLGMQMEELSEKLACVSFYCPDLHDLVLLLESKGEDLKSGRLDHHVASAIYEDAEEFLDGDLDLLWVTAGSLAAQGVDAEGAFGEVNRANWDKFIDGVATLDANGKVIKRPGWTEPNLKPFLPKGNV